MICFVHPLGNLIDVNSDLMKFVIPGLELRIIGIDYAPVYRHQSEKTSHIFDTAHLHSFLYKFFLMGGYTEKKFNRPGLICL